MTHEDALALIGAINGLDTTIIVAWVVLSLILTIAVGGAVTSAASRIVIALRAKDEE